MVVVEPRKDRLPLEIHDLRGAAGKGFLDCLLRAHRREPSIHHRESLGDVEVVVGGYHFRIAVDRIGGRPGGAAGEARRGDARDGQEG